MTEPPTRNDATIDEPLGEHTTGLRKKFEEAWQKAAVGGAEPSIDGFVSTCPEPERKRLRAELEEVARLCRQRRAAATEQTQSETPGTVRSGTESMTLDFAPDTKVDDSERTADFRPAEKAACEQGGTLDYAADSSADPESTLAGDPGLKGETVDFSVDSSAHETAADADQQTIPGYEILGTLGRGAMGVVYKARQRGLRRIVALKMILAGGHASETELSRFRTEAEAVGQLQHPNIVQVYEVGESNGCPFLSLEFVDGDSLQKKLGGMPQPVMQSAEMVLVLAHAMDFAHRKGIIHRDLKPANVLLMALKTAGAGESTTLSATPLMDSYYGTPKIADFGLAKRLEEDGGQTRSGTILGTPSYMAPEQAEGRSKEVGPLADQYALGAVLYEMLTGRPPFRGESVWDTLEQVRTQEPVPPSQLQPKVPRDLETICLKALQKEPQKRYADCAVLAEDLRRFVHSEPILARPVSPPERLWRWCRRNPKVAALFGLVAVSLIGGTVVSAMFGYRASKERDKAERSAEAARAAEAIATENEKEALQAKAVASDQAYLALDTLREVVGSIQSRLENIPSARDVRAEILEMAMARVKQVAEAGKKDAGLDSRIMGAAHSQMAGIYQSQDRPADAAREFQEAFVILERLATANPNSDKAMGNLAVALAALGDAKYNEAAEAERKRDYARRDGELAAAQADYRKALAIRKDIHDHPRNNELKRDEVKLSLAGSYEKLARYPASPAEIRDYYNIALKLRKEAVEINPDSIENKRALAKTYNVFGEFGLKESGPEKAFPYFGESVKLLKGLVERQPKDRKVRYEYANILNKLAELHLRMGEAAQSRKYYTETAEQLGELLKDDKSNDPLQLAFHSSRYGFAVAAQQEGDFKTADDLLRRELSFWQMRQIAFDSGDALSWCMLCGARLGEHARAAEFAETMRKKNPGDKGNLVIIASGYALCIGGVAHGKSEAQLTALERNMQKHYETLAFAALRKAKELGFADWADIESDPDFGPLLKNPAFKALMAEFKSPTKTATK